MNLLRTCQSVHSGWNDSLYKVYALYNWNTCGKFIVTAKISSNTLQYNCVIHYSSDLNKHSLPILLGNRLLWMWHIRYWWIKGNWLMKLGPQNLHQNFGQKFPAEYLLMAWNFWDTWLLRLKQWKWWCNN